MYLNLRVLSVLENKTKNVTLLGLIGAAIASQHPTCVWVEANLPCHVPTFSGKPPYPNLYPKAEAMVLS